MGDSTTDRSVTGLDGSFSLAYDSSTKTYTLKDEQHTAVFSATSFLTETNTPDYFPRVEYTVAAASDSDNLVIFKQCNCNPAIVNNYSSYGAWQHNQPTAGNTLIRLDYFTYGTPTPIAGMPHSGMVTYRLSGTGNYSSNTQLYFDQSYTTVTVDFLTGSVTTGLSLSGTDFLNANYGGLLGFSFSGTIAGNTADGPLSFTDASWGGVLHVTFFGPHAEDIGIVYSAASSSTATFNGAGVGTTP